MRKKAIIHNIIGGFSNFGFAFLTSIIFLPYYFKFISIADYGIWLGGISLLSLVSIFEANISLILTQQLGKQLINKNPLKFSKYLSAAIFFSLCVSVLIICITYFLKENITSWISPDEIEKKLFSNSFFLYSISLSLTIISGYIGSVFQVFLITFKQPIYNLIASFVGVFFTIWLVPSQGVLAIAFGFLIKSILYTLLIVLGSIKILKYNKINICFNLTYLPELLYSIGLPFISKVMMTSAMSAQNFLVAATISASATTIFEITKKLPLINISLVNIIAMATFTSFSLFYSENGDNSKLHKYTKHYFNLVRVLLVISLGSIFLIGQDFVTLWVGADKFGGNFLLALICIGAMSDQLRMILAQQYYALGKFNLTSITDLIFAISFFIFAALLMSILGLKGIVLSGILANVICFVVSSFLEKKRGVEMVPHIITKTLMIDLIIVISISAITMLILQLFIVSDLLKLLLIILSILSLIFIFYKKEQLLFKFLILKFNKSK